jgi:hypothetical protein
MLKLVMITTGGPYTGRPSYRLAHHLTGDPDTSCQDQRQSTELFPEDMNRDRDPFLYGIVPSSVPCDS